MSDIRQYLIESSVAMIRIWPRAGWETDCRISAIQKPFLTTRVWV